MFLKTKSHSHIFLYLIRIISSFSHVVSLSEAHGEITLHYRMKEWKPKVEPLEVHRISLLFVEVKVPNIFI